MRPKSGTKTGSRSRGRPRRAKPSKRSAVQNLNGDYLKAALRVERSKGAWATFIGFGNSSLSFDLYYLGRKLANQVKRQLSCQATASSERPLGELCRADDTWGGALGRKMAARRPVIGAFPALERPRNPKASCRIRTLEPALRAKCGCQGRLSGPENQVGG
jgi:hypothetical protein